MNALLRSGYLFIPLILLTPMSFFISKNYTQQTLPGNLLSLAASILIGLAGSALCAIALAVIRRVSGRPDGRFARLSEQRKKDIRHLVFAVTGVLVFPFFLQGGAEIPGSSIVAVLCVFFLIRIIGFYGLNIFLVAFTVISLVNIARAELSERAQYPEPPAGLPNDFALARKPNIYYFFLESMHDRETLRAQYDFDMPEFFAGLEERKFTPYDSFIANYVGTLESALAAFTMRHHYNAYGMNMVDATRAGFAVLAENSVFRTLKHNGYSVNLFDVNTGYVFRRVSPFVDFTHFGMELELIPGILETIGFFNPYLAAFAPEITRKTKKGDARIWKAFSEAYPMRFNLDSPSFFYIHFGANHAREYTKFYPEPGWEGWKTDYPELYREAADMLEDFLDLVLKNDPDALIILNGDHGAWKYGRQVGLDLDRRYLEGTADVNAFFREQGVEPATVGAALGEVLTAVRWPEGIAAPATPPKGLSHVTLFPFIFYALAGKEYDGTLFDENISVNLVNLDKRFMIFARDGKLLADWELLVRE